MAALELPPLLVSVEQEPSLLLRPEYALLVRHEQLHPVADLSRLSFHATLALVCNTGIMDHTNGGGTA